MDWMSSPEAKAQIAEQSRLALEQRVIKRIWDFANNRPPRLAEVVQECKLETGKATLNFAWFHDHYPEFPVRLGAAKIPWIHEVSVGDLFGPFTKLPFFKHYEKFLDELDLNPEEEQAALIFPWATIPKGGSAMVLHNYPVNEGTDDPNMRLERGTRIIRPLGNPVVIYVIESLNDFLANVGTTWAQ